MTHKHAIMQGLGLIAVIVIALIIVPVVKSQVDKVTKGVL